MRLFLLLLAACATARGAQPQDVAAVIVRPTAQSRAALAEAVSISLNGAQVTLADSALTDSSELAIERVPRRDPQGRLLDGRGTGEKPERFRLVKSGADCILVHEQTGRRLRLVDTECAAEITSAGGR